jgi:hypothetical protein
VTQDVGAAASLGAPGPDLALVAPASIDDAGAGGALPDPLLVGGAPPLALVGPSGMLELTTVTWILARSLYPFSCPKRYMMVGYETSRTQKPA